MTEEARFLVRVETDQAKRDVGKLKDDLKGAARDATGQSFLGSVKDAFLSPVRQAAAGLIQTGVNTAFGSAIPGGLDGLPSFFQQGLGRLGQVESLSGNGGAGTVLTELSGVIKSLRETVGEIAAQNRAIDRTTQIAGEAAKSGILLPTEAVQRLYEVLERIEQASERGQQKALDDIMSLKLSAR